MARKNVKDLTGEVFGCKKVLHRVPTPRGTNAWWRVECVHCGKQRDEMGSRLKLPSYQSCNCRRDTKGVTNYRIVDSVVYITDSRGVEFFIDLADFNLIKNYTWCSYVTTKGKTYIRCSYLKESLHRFY